MNLGRCNGIALSPSSLRNGLAVIGEGAGEASLEEDERPRGCRPSRAALRTATSGHLFVRDGPPGKSLGLIGPRLSAVVADFEDGPRRPNSPVGGLMAGPFRPKSLRNMRGLQRVVEHGVQRGGDVSGRVRGIEEAR